MKISLLSLRSPKKACSLSFVDKTQEAYTTIVQQGNTFLRVTDHDDEPDETSSFGAVHTKLLTIGSNSNFMVRNLEKNNIFLI